MPRFAEFVRSHDAQLRQAARVAIGTAFTYAAASLLDLPQGYWAVFTVIIVMQGSIASTLGAATDRLVGTIAGALIGAVAIIAIQHGDATKGVALTLVVAVTAFAAAKRPQLKTAPVTAAIMLTTQPPGFSTEIFVIHRVLEIALGGVIGVATSVLVFPARSQPLVIARAATAMAGMQRLLGRLADGIERGEPLSLADEHAGLRTTLTAVEQAAGDAERERASGLAYGATSPPIARALWRVRNDLVLVWRALDEPLPATVAEHIAAPAAALLRAEADHLGRCIAAIESGTPAAHGEDVARFVDFETAFGALRREGLTRALDFGDAGQVFGLAFAIEVLHRDIADLSDRFGKPTG